MSDALKNAITIERKETGKWMYELEFTIPADAVNAEFSNLSKRPETRPASGLPIAGSGYHLQDPLAEIITDECRPRNLRAAAFGKMNSDESLEFVFYGRPPPPGPSCRKRRFQLHV